MTAVAFWLLVSMAVVTCGAILIAWYFISEVDRLEGEHAARRRVSDATAQVSALLRRPAPLRQHKGRHLPRHGTVPTSLLNAEAVTDHADAMRELSEPYLPPSPAGEHPYPPYVRADRPVTRVRAEGDPFTGSQPVLTDEVIDQMRGEYLASYLSEHNGMTDDEVRAAMRDAMTALRKPDVTESVTAWRAQDVAAYGTDRCEADVDEAQRLAQVMQP